MNAGDTETDSMVTLLWGARKEARRGPKPSQSIESVTEAAIRLADANGIDRLSMQDIAAELGLTKMALYRYVSSKEELVALMVESAIGTAPRLEKIRGGWRPKMEAWARLQRTTWQAHPWLPDASRWQPGNDDDSQHARVIGPNELSMMNSAIAAFDGTPLSGAEKLDALFLLGSYNRSSLTSTSGDLFPWQVGVAIAPADEQEIRRQVDELQALSAAASAKPKRNSWDWGLKCILDGVAAAIEPA